MGHPIKFPDSGFENNTRHAFPQSGLAIPVSCCCTWAKACRWLVLHSPGTESSQMLVVGFNIKQKRSWNKVWKWRSDRC